MRRHSNRVGATNPALGINATQGSSWWTALQRAASEGHTMMRKVLMRHPEINLNYMSSGGWTAFHRAAHSGHEEVCRQILARVAEDSKKGGGGVTRPPATRISVGTDVFFVVSVLCRICH